MSIFTPNLVQLERWLRRIRASVGELNVATVARACNWQPALTFIGRIERGWRIAVRAFGRTHLR